MKTLSGFNFTVTDEVSTPRAQALATAAASAAKFMRSNGLSWHVDGQNFYITNGTETTVVPKADFETALLDKIPTMKPAPNASPKKP